MLTGCFSVGIDNKNSNSQAAGNDISETDNTNNQNGDLAISFIDVGQGDSILVRYKDKTMLIDAGMPDQGDKVVDYIHENNIGKIDILVATHPHADHIGGMSDVIKNFDIGSIYMPKAVTTTKTYENLLTAIKNKGLKVKTAKAGVKLDLGEGIEADMIAPNGSKYDDLNGYSAVIMLTYKEKRFLFTGDATAESEKEMLKKNYNLKADVLKIGHHGSQYSTSLPFLNAVKPSYAVISAGKGNDYHHPAKVTMNKLKNLQIPVYRTDECGTIKIICDGHHIEFNTKPGDYTPGK